MQQFTVTKSYKYEMKFVVYTESGDDAIKLVDDLDCSPNVSVDDTEVGGYSLDPSGPSVLSWDFPYYADHTGTTIKSYGNPKAPVDIEYQSASQTIRQMPQNYMLARRIGGVWVVDCDGAVSVNTALHVAMAIHCDGEKFNHGESVATAIIASMARCTIDVS